MKYSDVYDVNQKNQAEAEQTWLHHFSKLCYLVCFR